MRTEKLYYGAAYYDEYMPTSRVDEDMRLMKDAGMNVIRIAESTWSTWEPREGEFDFTSLHRMLRGAKRYGIDVIVGTPTYAIPPWLARKYPDILAETHSGPSRYGHRQNMDITHPGYRFHCERIIRRLMEEVQQYDHVIGFQLDNETKPYDTCGSRAQQLFRQWLMDKFGTVENLNRAFGLAYWSNSLGSWEDLPDVRGTINNSLAAEYEAFQRNLVTEFLLWQRSIVDEYRREDQFVTHNFDYEWRDYSHALQPDADQFRAARAVTVAGCDIYHPTASHLTGAEISFGGDLARGLKGGENFFVLETQAQGPVGRLPWPGQLRLQAFAHIANGANMVEYWHWHSIHNAIECHWKGVLSHDFTPGAVYREAKTIGADFARLSPRLKNLQRRSDVAFLVSNRSLTGLKHSYAFAGPNYGDILRWLYDSFFRLNVSVDILDDTARDYSGYKLVVTPGLYCAEDALLEALREYVRGGGQLLSSFRSFFCDENLKIRTACQPGGLTDVFGMTYDNFTVPEEVPGARQWMELLRPEEGTQVLLGYDHPAYAPYAAATWHPYGSGSAAYIAAMLEPPVLDALLERLLPKMGIRLLPCRWPLIVKEGMNDAGERIRFLLNYSSRPQTWQADRGCRELLSDKPLSPGESLPLAPWGAAVIREA